MSHGSHTSNMARNTRKAMDEAREAGHDLKDTVQEAQETLSNPFRKSAPMPRPRSKNNMKISAIRLPSITKWVASVLDS